MIRRNLDRRPTSLARAAAKRVLDELRIRSAAEIDVELIAAHHGVFVVYRRLAHEEGHLLRAGRAAVIAVDDRHAETAKGRFTVAHELGHYFQHRNTDQLDLSVCSDRELNDWYTANGQEHEANVFAAELLMPQSLFEPMCDRNRPSLHDVRALASSFRTSLTATAIRFVELSPEPCAVVHSSRGAIDWSFRTSDFAFQPSRGARLSAATYAADLFEGKQVDDRPQVVDGTSWPGGADLDVHEHSVRLGQTGNVLTLLWHPLRG